MAAPVEKLVGRFAGNRPAFVRRRVLPHLPPELGHLAEHLDRELYCVPGDPWEAIDLANAFEPEILAERTWLFNVEHWRVEDEAFALLEVAPLVLAGNITVKVFHAGVSPDRVCPRCGVVVGTPPPPGAAPAG